MKYLITGATGDIGSKVVDLLIQRGDRPGVFVRDARKARSRFPDRVEVFVGDLADPESMRAALKGVDELFLLNSGPQIPVRDDAAANVAKTAGVKHLVKLSSMDVQHGLAIGGWHERGEAAVRGRGGPFTFVRPAGFVWDLPAWAPSIKADGVVRTSSRAGRRPFIRSDEITAVAVKALTTGGYAGQSLAIPGPEALSFSEVTARIAGAIGKRLRFQPISADEARQLYS